MLLFWYFLLKLVVFVVQTLRTAAPFASVSAGCSSGSRGSFPSRTSSRCGRWDFFIFYETLKKNPTPAGRSCSLSSSGPLDSSAVRQLPPADRLLHPGVAERGADRLRSRLQHHSEGKVAAAGWCANERVCPDFLPTDPQHINELTMKLDLQGILCEAEAIYQQLVCCKVRRWALFGQRLLKDVSKWSRPPPQELPLKVQQVLGLYDPPSSQESSPESRSGEAQRLLDQSEAGAASPHAPSPH